MAVPDTTRTYVIRLTCPLIMGMSIMCPISSIANIKKSTAGFYRIQILILQTRFICAGDIELHIGVSTEYS
jgi:hypothetical protein